MEAQVRPEVQYVELRCTEGFGKLLGKLRVSGMPLPVDAENLAELPCPDCKRRLRAQGQNVRFVLHRYTFVGELVDSVVVQ